MIQDYNPFKNKNNSCLEAIVQVTKHVLSLTTTIFLFKLQHMKIVVINMQS